MFQTRRLCAVALLGTAFGAATSLSNSVAVPFKTEDGSTAGDPIWAQAGEILSLILDSGWAWAALAVLAGWLVGWWAPLAIVRSGLAGLLALMGATVAYHAMDSVLREESFSVGGVRFWWYASLIAGPVLGAIGSRLGRPGVIGLLAGLTVPVGATTQMIVLPSGSTLVPPTPAENLAKLIVGALAMAGAGLALARFFAHKRQLVTEPGS